MGVVGGADLTALGAWSMLPSYETRGSWAQCAVASEVDVQTSEATTGSADRGILFPRRPLDVRLTLQLVGDTVRVVTRDVEGLEGRDRGLHELRRERLVVAVEWGRRLLLNLGRDLAEDRIRARHLGVDRQVEGRLQPLLLGLHVQPCEQRVECGLLVRRVLGN